jgi:hypothetical protein
MGGIPMRSAGISTSDRERTGIREGALFFVQDMQDVWSVRFTCLLVCRSAIFIDSKGDGNRAAPWQKGLQDEERQGA